MGAVHLQHIPSCFGVWLCMQISKPACKLLQSHHVKFARPCQECLCTRSACLVAFLCPTLAAAPRPSPTPPALFPCSADECLVFQALMAPRELIEGQLGSAEDYMEEVDQSLQVIRSFHTAVAVACVAVLQCPSDSGSASNGRASHWV